MDKIAKILLSASFIALFPLGLLGPIYAIFVKNIGGDLLETGLSYGLFAITSGIFVIFLGKSNLFKKNLRTMVFFGYLLLTFGEAGYLLVQNATHLFIIQIIVGVAGGILEPSWDGLFSSNLTEERATSLWSLWAGGRDIITGIGAFAGAAIVSAYSFTALFTIMTVFNIAATIVSFRLLSVRNSP